MKNRIFKIITYIFILLQIIGFFFSIDRHLNIKSISIMLILSFFLYKLIPFNKLKKIPDKYNRLFKNKRIEYSRKDFKTFLLYTFIILLFWLPYYLIFYPGIFSYDVHRQIGYYTTWHPLLHTLILNSFYNISTNRNLGVGLYTFFQMLILSLSLSYSLLLLYRVKINKIIRIIILVFYSLIPIFPVMGISTTKDIFFTGNFLLFIIAILYYEIDEKNFWERKIYLLYIINGILVGLLRNNGLYIMILFLSIIAIKSKKLNYKRLNILTMLLIVLSYLTLLYSLHPILEHDNEKYSSIYQQMGFIYNYAKTDNKTKKEIKKYIPFVEAYHYNLSDHIKDTGVGYKYPKSFKKLALGLLFKYPIESLESILRTNQGNWYLLDLSCTNVHGTGYFFIYDYKMHGVNFNNRFSSIRNKVLKVLVNNHYKKDIIIFMLFSIALYNWLVILILLFTTYNKKSISSIYCLLILLFITMLLGPCVVIRYNLPIIVSIPPLLALSTYKKV